MEEVKKKKKLKNKPPLHDIIEQGRLVEEDGKLIFAWKKGEPAGYLVDQMRLMAGRGMIPYGVMECTMRLFNESTCGYMNEDSCYIFDASIPEK